MAGVYRPRYPERTVLYRVLFHHFERFVAEDEERFEKAYGYFRPIIKDQDAAGVLQVQAQAPVDGGRGAGGVFLISTHGRNYPFLMKCGLDSELNGRDRRAARKSKYPGVGGAQALRGAGGDMGRNIPIVI